MFARFAALILLCLVAAIASAQPEDLLLYAPFDGSSAAAVAHGHAASAANALLPFAPGLRGQAVELGGPCQFATAGNLSPDNGTLAMWLQPHWNGNDPATHYLFCVYGQRDLPESWMMNRFGLYAAGGKVIFGIYDKNKSYIQLDAPIGKWLAGEWHHLAVTWSGINGGGKAQLRLYLDGREAAKIDRDGMAVGPQNDFFDLGNDQDNNPKAGNALADDLFIYGRALTADEIAQGVEISREAKDAPAAATSEAPAPRKGWWDAQRPFRTDIILPSAPQARKDVFVQSRLDIGSELAALGLSAAVDEGSLCLVEVNAKTGAETGPLPLRVEDGIAEFAAPGVTLANTARSFRLYFRTMTYSFFQPLVASRSASKSAAPQTLPQVPDYATAAYGKPWDFADDLAGIDQWGNKPDYIQNRKVVDHVLSMDVHDDPWFIWGDMWGQVDQAKRKVAIDLVKYPVLEMKVRQSVPSAEWELFGRVGKSDSLLTYKWPVTGTGWQRVRIDLRRQAHWGGVLSAFRIDPTHGASAHVEIAWVRLIAATVVDPSQVQTLGYPSAAPAQLALTIPTRVRQTGQVSDVMALVRDAAGKPVQGQPVTISLQSGSGGILRQAKTQRTLELTPQSRTGLTDSQGLVTVEYESSHRPGQAADTLHAVANFTSLKPAAPTSVQVIAGPPHHFVVSPQRAIAVISGQGPVPITAQITDEFDNPLPAAGLPVKWSVSDATLTDTRSQTDATGKATAHLNPDYAKRWVYSVEVTDGAKLTGHSADICLISKAPRPNPVKLGKNGMYVTGDGKPWVALGGFYANWVGTPGSNGEEGRRLLSFTDATEDQMVHWLEFLHSQGVTAMRFMLRTHRPNGMEPMDIGGRVNMELFAKALRYMDLARRYDIRFMLTLHEDYTKPVYCNEDALIKWALPKYAGENLDLLPPFQRRFIRDRRLVEAAGDRYTDPDAIACQDQYARQLIAMLKGNPQVFSYELENEMVNCPANWANHAMATVRSVDPDTLLCVSHGGGGLETADPLWWRKNTTIDFYTYHLYAYPGTVTPNIDFGDSADILTRYGRMAAPCQLGETAGDEFEYQSDPEVRRYVMRDLIWFSLVNGNPGCFFWNARGYEVEQFRLAGKTLSQFDLTTWKRARPEIGINVSHPITDDKYYRTQEGHENHAMEGKYSQYYLSMGADFDFTMDSAGYSKSADLSAFTPPQPSHRYFTVTPGWQLAYNAREGYSEGFAYVRNMADIQLWEIPGKLKMWLRTRKPAPLKIAFDLPVQGGRMTATDLDTGEMREVQLAGKGEVDLGETNHDWALTWNSK